MRDDCAPGHCLIGCERQVTEGGDGQDDEEDTSYDVQQCARGHANALYESTRESIRHRERHSHCRRDDGDSQCARAPHHLFYESRERI